VARCAGTSSTSTHYINELSSLVELRVKAKEEVDNFYHMGCIGTSAGFASKSVLVDEPVRLVEIADMEEELREEKKQVENLRGVRVLQRRGNYVMGIDCVMLIRITSHLPTFRYTSIVPVHCYRKYKFYPDLHKTIYFVLFH